MRLTALLNHSKTHVGKTAVVTASTDGIGLAIARRLGQDGAKVWISSRKEDNVKKAIDTLRDEGLDVNGLGNGFVFRFNYNLNVVHLCTTSDCIINYALFMCILILASLSRRTECASINVNKYCNGKRWKN